MIDYFSGLSTAGKIKLMLTFIPYCIIFVPLYLTMKIGELADSIGMTWTWNYKSWLEAEHIENENTK